MPLSGHADVAFLMTLPMTLNLHRKTILTSYSLVQRVNQRGKLINRIPGSRLLITSLPGSALRMHVESLGKSRDVNKRSVNLLSKGTQLVFSISYVIHLLINSLYAGKV